MASQRQRIVVIEGDHALREFISRTLKSQGFDVVPVVDVQQLSRLDTHTPALILLNLALPGADGLEVCQRLRRRSAAPIIVYTAFNDETKKSAALDLGADDFLSAPFSADDLVARVRLVLRQPQAHSRSPQSGTLRIGKLELNLQAQSLVRDGKPIALSRTDWALLELLVRNAGQVLTHRMLLEQVWGDAYSNEHGYLRTYINRLRGKLEDDPKHPQYLLTESRIGYRFVLREWEQQLPADAAPPLVTPSLPLPPTSFVGREAEIDAVQALLGRADLRLLTLAGPGGVGKTRLALQIATRAGAAFADGVAFVALAAARTPEMLISTLGKAFQIKETSGQSLFEGLKHELHAKELLLILDNFEQVLDAAPLVAELLQTSSRLKVLVTSRSPLHIYGEHELVVRPLALPDPESVQSAAELIAQPAVALFVDRAGAVKPDFALNDEQMAAVAEICARLDGLPLAIELAAAWSKILAPQAIAARLSNRLALLTGGARDLPVRQQTLRSTLNWSYELLDAEQKALFARLAVFVGGGTLDTLEEVCQDQPGATIDLLARLAALVDASLLQQEPSDQPRFVMLETIHEYAWEQLTQSGELELMQRRHAEHYMRLAESSAALAVPDQPHWLSRLEREHDNLRAALEWARAQHESELLLRLASALWNFWHTHGHQREGRQWLVAALAQSEQLSSALRAKALYGLGWLARDQGDYARAATYHRESLALFRQLNDPHGIADALRGVGDLALSQGDFAQAQALFEESLALSRPGASSEDRAWSLHHLGRVALEQGAYSQARALIAESLALFRTFNVQTGLAWSLHNLGRVALEQQIHSEAQTLIAESLELFRELGDKIGSAWSLLNLGRVALEQSAYVQAIALLEHGLALFYELSEKEGLAWSHYSLGRAALGQKAYGFARIQFEEALRFFRMLNDQAGVAWAIDQLAQLASARDDDEHAHRFREQGRRGCT